MALHLPTIYWQIYLSDQVWSIFISIVSKQKNNLQWNFSKKQLRFSAERKYQLETIFL